MEIHKEEIENAIDAFSRKDYAKVISIIEPLIKMGVPGALSLMGLMNQLGEGVELNGEKAVGFLLRAAALGDGAAAHNLGTIYAMGLPKVEVDLESSKQYYRLAKKMGFQVASDEFYE